MGEIVANGLAAVCVLLRASWGQQRQETRKQHTSNIKYGHLDDNKWPPGLYTSSKYRATILTRSRSLERGLRVTVPAFVLSIHR
jgi:hypothetical protein